MKRIVIPGGTGYLGRALAELLVARGDDVVMLSRSGKSRVWLSCCGMGWPHCGLVGT